MNKVAEMPGVQTVTADQCQFGMQADFHGQAHPIKKPTKWMSNMKGVTEVLHRMCSGGDGLCSDGRQHATCTGKQSENVAIYPLKFCKAILQGITSHLRQVGLLHEGRMGIMPDAED